MMCRRAVDREAFGGPLADQGVVREWIARSRMEIDQVRLLTLKASWLMDTAGQRRGPLRRGRDQGRRDGGRPQRRQPRRADVRRRGRQRRHGARPALRDHPGPADRRRPERGAPAHDRQARAAYPSGRRGGYRGGTHDASTGKVALVTGATRGLGFAIASGARPGGRHGRRVEPQGTRPARSRGEAITEATGVTATPARAARRTVGRDRARRRRRSTPSSAASTSSSTTPGSPPCRPRCSRSVSESLFDKTIEVNLKGPFRLMAVAGARMAAAGGGSIVNISSIGAVRPSPPEAMYAAVQERPQRAHHGVRPGVRPARAGQLRDAGRLRDRHGGRTGTTSSSARSSTGSPPAGSDGPTRSSAWSSTSPADAPATRPAR